MIVTRGLATPTPGSVGQRAVSAVTIGNFDGVHRGHQAMLARLADVAAARGLAICALTFEPHPREVFTPQQAPTRLTSLREKLELLQAHGVARTHVANFTRAFAAMSPPDFIERVLVRTLGARWILVGEDFRFGARRAGDVAMLRTEGMRHGFEVEAMSNVELDGLRISSSAVRTALAAGELDRAALLLGRRYSISGRVVHGDKLGRELGFATANIQLKHNRMPLAGVFAVRLHGVGQRARDGVASLGVRPTVKADGAAPALEVHLFDYFGELYGRHVRVEFLRKIRDEEKYSDLETLKAKIADDCKAARKILLEIGND
jgi:riboflavin kinase/FMN adenylyltransferase